MIVTPFSTEGQQLAALIRSKATNEEIEPVINSIEKQAKTTSNIDPLLVSTDAFVTAICYIGSKSLSHLLSCIERNKERLLAIGPRSPAARRQIITSVMTYWKYQPGIGVNIVDKLLNYTILTPRSVIEWALIDTQVDRGTNLASSHIYEMIASTVHKVTNRVRQIVAAYRQPGGLPEEQSRLLLATLEQERTEMKQLFGIIDEALLSIATGSTDQIMQGDDTLTGEDQELVGRWAQRWLKVFQRQLIVEEIWIKEEMIRPIPPPAPEVSSIIMEDIKTDDHEGGNGVVNGKGDDGIE